ncbi:MAG: hypothetical protein IKZ81_06770 [Clostridia bacterium]|nr:hypothetical protein [Clostridia bacterium]MBR5768737.1 hypothetical protein [Clostridia bacterium]MBR5943031.1 hypothetical protein [Clostridia bacterium]
MTLAPVTAANAASAGYLIGRGETLGGVSEKSGTPAGLIYFRQEEKTQWQPKRK